VDVCCAGEMFGKAAAIRTIARRARKFLKMRGAVTGWIIEAAIQGAQLISSRTSDQIIAGQIVPFSVEIF
jgi:hypothetical protein